MIPNSYSFHEAALKRLPLLHTIVPLLLLLLSPLAPLSALTDCKAEAGTLGAPQVCLTDDKATLSATPSGDAFIPKGYVRLFVLTSGEELVIEQVSPLSTFDVNPEGSYTIHTLIFDPATLDLGIVDFGVTTGFDVNGLLIQGGGDICAALDVAGAKFSFEKCQTACNAYAGTLRAIENDCFAEGQTRLTAESVAAPIAPQGFSILYVLTSGEELVIENVSDQPSFIVEGDGRYTIHTLVYDPETLNLGIVEFGVTTGVDVNGLLAQGGGAICAALDVAGAPFMVEPCTAELACKAEFGQLAKKKVDCIEDGVGYFEARVKVAPTVPEGFSLLYVLTSGQELVIENVSTEPAFDIAEEGFYTIHTLVYDPETLNLGIVEFGTTTGVDVNNLLVQGGGDICAALDVVGVSAEIEECGCKAYAGRLTQKSQTCIEANEPAKIVARRAIRPRLPSSDYEIIYVLTSGNNLVIQDVNTRPAFEVTEEGTYTIHTLVYDPATLDLGIVEFGKTTGFDVNALLVQGGGDICAALDVTGARFFVKYCDDVCTADFGALKPYPIGCYNGQRWVRVSARLTERPVVPHGYKVIYVLTTGEELVIRAASYYPVFYVKGTGRVTIHTLVYNPRTLDLSIIQAGKTTGGDVNKLLIQGGGDICAALDVAGAQFNISSCGNSHLQSTTSGLDQYQSRLEVSLPASPATEENLSEQYPNLRVPAIDQANIDNWRGDLQAPSVYPNPASNSLQLELPQAFTGKNLVIDILDMNGSIVKQLKVNNAALRSRIDVTELVKGMYTLRIKLPDGTVENNLFSKF
jgi:hypothetical protein